MTQTDLFEAIAKDTKRAAPEDVYGPLAPETWEPRFADIRDRLQEHAYWCKRAGFAPLDMARDCDFLLQLIEKEADPASIETTAAHWFEKYQAEAAKRGELIIEAEKLRAERDSYLDATLEANRIASGHEETTAALIALLDAVNTMAYPRHHPAYGMAVRVARAMRRPYPIGVAVPRLLKAVKAALPHLSAAVEPCDAARPGAGEFIAAVIAECEEAIRYGETGSAYSEGEQAAPVERDARDVAYFRAFDQLLSWKAVAHDAIDAIRVFQSHRPETFLDTLAALERRSQALVNADSLGG